MRVRGSLVVFLGLVLFAAVAPASAQQDEVVDEIVAVVGEQIVLRSDVDGLVLSTLQQQREIDYSDALWVDALNRLIDQKVLAVHARRDTTIQVTEEQVDQALDDRINQLTQQVGSTAEIEQIYGKSIVQIKADLREEFRERIMAERFQGRKMQQIKITPSEVENWFSQFPTDSLPTLPTVVRLSHIVRYPTVPPEAEQEALEIITAIRDSVVTGTSTLEQMARFSDDPGSVNTEGRYPEMQLGSLVPEFAAVAARLDLNVVSEPFRTPFGYHILRVNDRRGDVLDFSHILITIDNSKADPADAIAYLNTVRDSLKTFEMPFALMARRHSEEEMTKEIGGRVIDPQTGERDLFLDALGPTWRSTLDTMEVGQISEPGLVETLDNKRAYHLVKLEKLIPPHRVDIETDYTRIEQFALREKRNRVLRRWLDALREDVYVELRGKAEALTAGILGHAEDRTARN